MAFLVFQKANRLRLKILANSILTIFSKNCALPQRNASDIELFLTGIITAEFFYAVVKWSVIKRGLLLIFSLLLFFMLFFTDMLLMPDNPFLWRMLNGIAAAVMVLALSTAQKKCNIEWLVLGGKISYGIYMYHMIVITGLIFIFQKLPVHGFSVVLGVNILSMVFTYLLALLSYRLYESKFLKMKKY